MNFEEWLKTVPCEITNDVLWKVEVYRLALLLSDLSWYDVTKLIRDKRTLELSSQLYEAVGSISANIAEGYSRGTGRDRARFYEYSLGSARESRDWYFKGRHVLGDQITKHRFGLLVQTIRLLLTMIPEQRGRILRESSALYLTEPNMFAPKGLADGRDLPGLLHDIPIPE